MLNFHRRTWVEIDLDAIKHNYMEIKNVTDTKICCVIKADAYGHGAVALARIYEKIGAEYFGVSNIDEALQLRKQNIKVPILIFGYSPAIDASVLSCEDISQCVYSLEYAKALSEQCVAQNVKAKIHIKIDTGMSRLGFFFQNPERDKEALSEIREVCQLPNLIPEGIFTHFAVSDEGTDEFTLKQLENFKKAIDELSDINFKYKHCANSAASLDFSNSYFDMIRAGIILYGLEPSSQIRNKINLKPALSLKSLISHIKTIEKGSTVSYGRSYTAEKKMKIATVPIGYADGYTRILAERDTQALIKGKRRKIIGRICMDQMMLLLEDEDDFKIGDTVVLIGESGDDFISVDEIAQKRDTINYEVVCDLGARVPRVYYEDGKQIDIFNYISQ